MILLIKNKLINLLLKIKTTALRKKYYFKNKKYIESNDIKFKYFVIEIPNSSLIPEKDIKMSKSISYKHNKIIILKKFINFVNYIYNCKK